MAGVSPKNRLEKPPIEAAFLCAGLPVRALALENHQTAPNSHKIWVTLEWMEQ
jgi:hypothetical protein